MKTKNNDDEAQSLTKAAFELVASLFVIVGFFALLVGIIIGIVFPLVGFICAGSGIFLAVIGAYVISEIEDRRYSALLENREPFPTDLTDSSTKMVVGLSTTNSEEFLNEASDTEDLNISPVKTPANPEVSPEVSAEETSASRLPLNR